MILCDEVSQRPTVDWWISSLKSQYPRNKLDSVESAINPFHIL